MRDHNIVLFVDINNLFHSAMKKYGGRPDYKKLLEDVSKHGRIKSAFAFGSGTDNEDTESFRALLRHLGYEVRWANGRYNWNVGIAMEIVRQSKNCELVVLCSNDAFLSPVAEWIRQQGIKCYGYGFRISQDMRQSVDRFFEIPEGLLVNVDTIITK